MPDKKLTHMSLFSGIGGIDIAAEWAGFETVGQCEFADYPTKVLEKHWPDVPRWKDVRDVTLESFRDRTGLRTVDLISGGIPCQPFSVAGKQKGKEDARYLWPEMLRVVTEIKPTWVLVENVPGILRFAADDICKDLGREGYSVGIFNYEAAAVGAPHRRARVFFVGNAKHDGQSTGAVNGIDIEDAGKRTKGTQPTVKFTRTGRPGNNETVADTKSHIERRLPFGKSKTDTGFVGSGQYVCNADYTGLQVTRQKSRYKVVSSKVRVKLTDRRSIKSRLGRVVDGISDWLYRNLNPWKIEPNIPRIANGVKNRVERLKCLGNAVVPQQIYPILAAIADIEKTNNTATD